MTTETDNVIEYKNPDQKKWFEVMHIIECQVEAESKEHAKEVARDLFDYSDLNYATVMVKPLDNEATDDQ